MFDSLVNWLIDPIQSLCTTITTWFLQVMTMTVSEFQEQFPAVAVLYSILQAVAIGLIVVIATWSFLKVIIGSQYATESPLKTAGFTVLSVAMVFFGNNLLELVLNLFSYPYSAIFAADTITFNVESAFSTMVDIIWDAVGGIEFLLGKSIIFMVIMIVITWKIFKLIGEMLQRWMMLSILVYTSPLAWSLLAGSSTRQMFTRWINMFISQCVVLLLNAWCVKIILSSMGAGISSIAGVGGTFGFIRYFLLISCFIKIATSMDSYVAQIGLNPVQVGRSFLDEMITTGSRMGRTLIGGSLMKAVGGGPSGSTAVLGSTAQRSAASAATSNINARTNMTAGQRIGSAIAHPIRTAQAMAMENREAMAGNMYRDKATGQAYTGNEAKKILAMHRRNGQLPNGVEAIYGNSAAVETGTAVAGNVMAANNVHTGKDGNNAPGLIGTKTDIANTVAHAGGVVDGTPYQQAFGNTAVSMDATTLNATINESVNNNGTVADRLMTNLAQKSGIETEVGNYNLNQINERAGDMIADAEQTEFLMKNTGSATVMTPEQAQEVQHSLENNFGENANVQNFRNMYHGYTPANSASGATYTVREMTGSGAASALSIMQASNSVAIADASENLSHAQSLYNQASVVESEGNHSQANYLTNEANKYQQQAIDRVNSVHETLSSYSAGNVTDVTLSDYANRDTLAETQAALNAVTHENRNFDSMRDDAAVPKSATWDDMSHVARQAELDHFTASFDEDVRTGNSRQAVQRSITATGYATPKGRTVAEVESSTADTAKDTVNNMVYGRNHATVNFTGSSVHKGEGNGTMRYQSFDIASGTYKTTYDKIRVATTKVDSDRRSDFTEHQIGDTKFYTRRTLRPLNTTTINASKERKPQSAADIRKDSKKDKRKK